VVLVGVGVLIGVLIEGGDGNPSSEALQASEIGNAKEGRELFVSQGCSMCHSFEGRGGTDAPELDFMKGELTVNEIANMNGMIWNHMPMMQAAFAEEHIPFPEFTKNQMASLIAYLHGGGPPPDVKMGPESMGGQQMGGQQMGGGAQGGEQMGGQQMQTK
jgi:mono/diheme cytochrome c family protein